MFFVFSQYSLYIFSFEKILYKLSILRFPSFFFIMGHTCTTPLDCIAIVPFMHQLYLLLYKKSILFLLKFKYLFGVISPLIFVFCFLQTHIFAKNSFDIYSNIGILLTAIFLVVIIEIVNSYPHFFNCSNVSICLLIIDLLIPNELYSSSSAPKKVITKSIMPTFSLSFCSISLFISKPLHTIVNLLGQIKLINSTSFF